MNSIAKQIASYLGSAELTDDEFLEHYGMPRRSGRYPWGSGEDPYQHEDSFLHRIFELKQKGWTETPENINKEFGLTTTEYRIEKSIHNDQVKALKIDKAKSLRADGKSNSEIGREMGVNESTVRGWFDQEQKARYEQAQKTADILKDQIKSKKMIDVGADAELELGVSRQKLDTALYLLKREGYGVYNNRIPQPTNKNQMTTQKVLVDKDIASKVPDGKKVPKEIYEYDKIKPINEYISKDNGRTFEKRFTYPASMDGKRIKVVLRDEIGPDGLKGSDQDGLIQIRRGVDDLSLNGSRYAQVRILVDKNKYLKGMAVYSDNIPDGYDLVFNSNKKTREDSFKKIKDDPENPFGSAIKDADQGGQYWYIDKKTGKKKLGLINKRADEGDWTEWADSLPSQFLSKQSKQLAKKQLDLAKADKLAEFDEIKSLTNPTIKKYYLEEFASKCDKAAVDLKAAALPGQKYHVIIPINTLKESEIYAPQYKDGTKLALIRYPHGGIFEIPVVTVNNKSAHARKIIGKDSIDAVGINKKVADRLSGADFDGDTVMCIPTDDKKGKIKIIRKDQLEGLKGFDPKDAYGPETYKGRTIKTMKNTNLEMGKISNLITDMTIGGADDAELARAVRHSMVVIDAEKHKLDYQKSYVDNGIASLKKKYQIKLDKDGNPTGKFGGASTIISRSKGEVNVLKRKGQAKINKIGKPWYDPNKPEGSLIYTTAPDKEVYYADSKYDKKTGIKTITKSDGKKITYNMNSKADREKYDPVMRKTKTGEVYYTNKDGTIRYRTKARTIKSTQMAEADDAMKLVSKGKHPIEIVYADYANSMKALANTARKEMIYTKNLQYNPTAKKTYAKEVASLTAKLNDALKNSGKERQASRLAVSEINKRKEKEPKMSSKDLGKLSQRIMSKYRDQVGSVSRKKRNIVITDREWEAIQSGAITENKLKKILRNSDPAILREKAMPRTRKTLSVAQINRIKALNSSNFTLSQIAEKMNLPPTTVSNYLKGNI